MVSGRVEPTVSGVQLHACSVFCVKKSFDALDFFKAQIFNKARVKINQPLKKYQKMFFPVQK